MVTDREKLEHLLNGGLLVSDSMYKGLNSEGMVVVASSTDMSTASLSGFLSFQQMDIYIEPKWWDNIPPEGIVCKVLTSNYAVVIQRLKPLSENYDLNFIKLTTFNVDYPVSYHVADLEPLNEEQLAAYELLKSIGT